MRKPLHHYRKNLVTDSGVDYLDWDLVRVINDDVVTYELVATLVYTVDPSFCPTPENLCYIAELPISGVIECDVTIKSYDKLTGIVVVGGMVTYPDLDTATQVFTEIIQRLVA